MNPLLSSLFPPFFTPLSTTLSQRRGSCGRADIEGLPLARNRAAWLHVDASWRRMLVCQPPCTSMGVATPETGFAVLYSRQRAEAERMRMRNRERRRRAVVEQEEKEWEREREMVREGNGGNDSVSDGEDRDASVGTCTSTPPKQEQEQQQQQQHDGLIRMWDLYDAVVRGLADPGMKWTVLWRPREPVMSTRLPSSAAAGTPLMDEEQQGGPAAFFNEEGEGNEEDKAAEQATRDANLAAWRCLPPTRDLSAHNFASIAGFAYPDNHPGNIPSSNSGSVDNNNNNHIENPYRSQREEDLLGGCTAELMRRGAQLIVVRRREGAAFAGWAGFPEVQGRFVNPRWLGRSNAGGGVSGRGSVMRCLERDGGELREVVQ
ncbi:hypothetical protein Micbo1qcDRAFT_208678 [Microdochium bolleyi]|uniref:Uncharacterized protein n=1 Tax=Microdochium bolleyi TaxID=196109 RepID=A0A136IPS0_9PEZI|nr:hypothetical protein Micbo1qcDRAFT_208678 [Microdochium bolleyi]